LIVRLIGEEKRKREEEWSVRDGLDTKGVRKKRCEDCQ
jgi:hypothetical protein